MPTPLSHSRSPVLRRAAATLSLAVLATACGDKPSKQEAERLITQYPLFKTPKTARIPQRIVLGMAYGNSHPGLQLTNEDWLNVDWVTHALSTARYVRVVDNARPMAMNDDSYEHFINVALTAEGQQTGDFVDDEDDPEPGWGNLPPSRTPGWKVAIARRKLEGIVELLDKNTSTERILPGNAVAYIDFKWIPTTTGVLFDQGGDDINRLGLQAAANARQFFKLDSRLPLRAKVYFNRVEKGRWMVKGMECGRCGWFTATP